MNSSFSVRCFAAAIASVAFASFTPLAALAQESSLEYPMIGAGARIRPAYDGSSTQRAEPVPVVRYYGHPPEQAPTTGLAAFRAGSGLLFTSVGLIWSFDLTRDWVAVGNLEVHHLHGDAARSPLTERTSNYHAVVGVAYRLSVRP